MVHIYTFCDKTLVGKKENKTANFLSENLFKMNFKIQESCVFCNSYDYENLKFKNKDIYFLLMQKQNSKLSDVLASLCNCECKENVMLKNAVTNFYKQKNVPLENIASLEWTIPSLAIAITNPFGKTQGYSLKIADANIFVLPNNFDEFLQIFNDCLLEYIETNFDIEYISETYKTFGINEQNLYILLKDVIKNKDKIYVSIFSKGLDNDIVIKAKKDNQNFETYRRKIHDILENYIYSVQNQSLNELLKKLLQENNIKLSFAGDMSLNVLLNNLILNQMQENVLQSHCLNSEEIYKYFTDKFINESSKNSELAFDIAVKLLPTKADLVVCMLYDEENNICYIALGNKNKIDIYKNVFYGSKEDILKNFANTVEFYLIKKIKSREYKLI